METIETVIKSLQGSKKVIDKHELMDIIRKLNDLYEYITLLKECDDILNSNDTTSQNRLKEIVADSRIEIRSNTIDRDDLIYCLKMKYRLPNFSPDDILTICRELDNSLQISFISIFLLYEIDLTPDDSNYKAQLRLENNGSYNWNNQEVESLRRYHETLRLDESRNSHSIDGMKPSSHIMKIKFTATDLLELAYGLIEAGYVKVNKKDKFCIDFGKFFGLNIKDPNGLMSHAIHGDATEERTAIFTKKIMDYFNEYADSQREKKAQTTPPKKY